MEKKRKYSRPELVKVGHAADLVLGSCGCCDTADSDPSTSRKSYGCGCS